MPFCVSCPASVQNIMNCTCTGTPTDARTAGLEPQPGLVRQGCSIAGIRVEHGLSRLDVIFTAAASGLATRAEAHGMHSTRSST